MAAVVGVATGSERATPDNDVSAYEAHGLTATVRAAAEPLVGEDRKAGWAITDLTFELRRVYEWQAMLVRTRKVWGEPYVVDAPAQRMGQLGAAAVPFGLALAALGWHHGSAPAPVAVVLAGSEGGDRGAVLLAERA
jgi:3-oxoacyl-[acyl-carrier-protein] synthase-1